MRYKIQNRYYKQIITALLTISLLPIIFLGYYVYSFVSQQMSAVYRSYASRLENQKEEFETNFRYVDVSMIRLGLKNTCQKAINKERVAQNFQIFNTMKEELLLIGNTEGYLEQMYLVSQSQNWILGNGVSEFLDRYPEREKIQELLGIQEASFWHSDQKFLYLCKRVPINASRGGGMLMARFDKEAMLKGILGDAEDGITLIVDKDNQVMMSSEEGTRIHQAMANPDEMRRLYRDTDITKIRYQGQRFVILQSISDYNGWKYMLALPEEKITANMWGILAMVVMVILGLAVADTLAVMALSRKLYRPIDEIDTAVRRGIGAGKEDMEEISDDGGLMDRVKYMVTQNADMSQKLAHGKRNERQLFLRRIYQGEIISPSRELFEKHGFFMETYEGGTWFVMTIKYHNPFKDENDRQLYLFALDNIVSELINEEDTFPPVTIGSLMYLTCWIKTDSSESTVMKMQMLAIMITTTVKKYIDMPLNIGISQGFTNLQNITMGINESNKALQNAMRAEGEVNFYHSHHTTTENTKGYAAKKKRVQLLHYIDLGEQEACQKELDSYIFGLSDLYYHMFKLELCKLVSEILSIYQDYAIEPDYDKVGDIIDFDIGKTVNTYERLRDYLWSYLLDPLFQVICSQAGERDQWKEIVEYLLENLEKDISLEECARHFNYNANYLSRWFKKKMGMTYTDFVTGKKMDLCKSLLADSDISVNELAERFGYSSPQNFIRVFKKYTLMTPGQYRKSEREKLKIF